MRSKVEGGLSVRDDVAQVAGQGEAVGGELGSLRPRGARLKRPLPNKAGQSDVRGLWRGPVGRASCWKQTCDARHQRKGLCGEAQRRWTTIEAPHLCARRFVAADGDSETAATFLKDSRVPDDPTHRWLSNARRADQVPMDSIAASWITPDATPQIKMAARSSAPESTCSLIKMLAYTQSVHRCLEALQDHTDAVPCFQS